MTKRILLVGGGSGGHVYPLVAVAKALEKKTSELNISAEILMLGHGNFLERAARENHIQFKKISAGKLRRYPSLENLTDLLKIPMSFIQSFWHLFLFMPDIVFVKGGYASLAPAVVARLYFIPVFVHESDSVPGLANVIIGKIAKKIFLSFKTSEKYFNPSKSILTGNPTRMSLVRGDKSSAQNYFNFSEKKPIILIIGGSQGAKIINDIILGGLVILIGKFNIIHQCGDKNYPDVKKETERILKEGSGQYAQLIQNNYKFYPFFDENSLVLAYTMADLVIARAGAGLLFEIAQAGKPAIIIPISQSSRNHQYINAMEFGNFGARVIEEGNFNLESLEREINSILKPENYNTLSEKIKTFAKPEAAAKIAEVILGN